MQADVVIRVRFKTTSEGGRSTDVGGTDYYACPLFIDREAFDCRLLLGGKTLRLGESYDIPVAFLDRESAFARLSLGKEVTLWEGKVIGVATVVDMKY